MPEWLNGEYTPMLLDAARGFAYSASRILLVLLGGWVAVRVQRAGIRRLEDALVRAREKSERVRGATRKRVATLTNLLSTLGTVITWSVTLVICLGQIGIDIGPILAGAGVLGLAVGFGAQNLVRDLISGFFLVLEDQIRVGDVAIVNGTGGLVEAVTFRTVILRDLSGVVHVFPNGTINTLSNMTKGWSGYVLDVGVAYKEDTDHVIEVMKEVDDDLRNDREFGQHILQPIEVFGVDSFGASEVVIKARIKTQPIQQWFVGREYRRRLKKAFDAKGIEIPFPHQSIYVGEASKPLEVLLKQAVPK